MSRSTARRVSFLNSLPNDLWQRLVGRRSLRELVPRVPPYLIEVHELVEIQHQQAESLQRGFAAQAILALQPPHEPQPSLDLRRRRVASRGEAEGQPHLIGRAGAGFFAEARG